MEHSAQTARNHYERFGLPDNTNGLPPSTEDVWEAAHKRMKRPEGDPLPKSPKHSKKRRIELD